MTSPLHGEGPEFDSRREQIFFSILKYWRIFTNLIIHFLLQLFIYQELDFRIYFNHNFIFSQIVNVGKKQENQIWKKRIKILSKSIECFYYNKNEQILKKEQKSDNYEINLIKA